MQHTVLNRATLQVADTMGVSGRVTADSNNDGARAQTKSSLWRACALMIFCSVVSMGALASLTPVSAFADPGGIPAEIAQLKAQVAALQSQVEALQDQLAAVQSNNALKLGKFVTVDPNPEKGVRGPNITFKGANIHIVSGSGATDDNLSHGGTLTGLGNLIIGYDELFAGEIVNRGGSHNLVIGMFHTFTSSAFGGLVAGEQNTIGNEAASVSGGAANIASGPDASVSGGVFNQATNLNASVSGGVNNTASGIDSSVSGGSLNNATGNTASVSGGALNNAGFDSSSVSGGFGNAASGQFASVSGGQSNSASGDSSVVLGGLNNTASGFDSSVSGGQSNTAVGDYSVVLGGSNNPALTNGSIAPHPPFP